MATNFNLTPQASPHGGGVYDPVMEAIRARSPQSVIGQNSPARAMFDSQAFSDNVGRYHPLFQQQDQMQDVMGLLQAMGGMAGGGGGGSAPPLGNFEDFFNRLKDPLLASLVPGEDRARSQIKNRLLAEGGANALSSGQGMNAMSTLESELGANRQGLLAKAMQDAMGGLITQRGQDTQLAASQNQTRFSMLNSLLGPLFSSMFAK